MTILRDQDHGGFEHHAAPKESLSISPVFVATTGIAETVWERQQYWDIER
jgi:hypothetical protein